MKLKEVAVGGEFKIGADSFIVLDQEDGKTFVVSKGFMLESQAFGDTPDYRESKLRNRIEAEIQPKIEARVGAENILEHVADLVTMDMQHDFGTLNCKVRSFTFDEARKYNDLLANKDLDSWTWTCTSWSVEDRGWNLAVVCVWQDGVFSDCRCHNCGGVRPVMWLNGNIEI